MSKIQKSLIAAEKKRSIARLELARSMNYKHQTIEKVASKKTVAHQLRYKSNFSCTH